MTIDMERMRALSLQGLRDCIAEGRMTQEKWDKLHPETREAVRDNSELSPQLVGLEGWRVRVTDAEGKHPRKFIVGKSTGWRPCHLEIKTARSMGGDPAARYYANVQRIAKVR